MTAARPLPRRALECVHRVHRKYYNTTNYIAIMVTILVILQIWWMYGGGHR